MMMTYECQCHGRLENYSRVQQVYTRHGVLRGHLLDLYQLNTSKQTNIHPIYMTD